MNKPGTKFYLAIGVVAFQALMFFALLIAGKFTEGMLIPFLSAPVATFAAFGIANVTASGQASKATQEVPK